MVLNYGMTQIATQKVKSSELRDFVRRYQGLEKDSPSLVTTHSLGTDDMWCKLHQIKLNFFNKITNSKYNYIWKMLFIIRLIEFVYGTWSNMINSVPDIVNILSQFEISSFVEDFLLSHDRIPKVQWKQYVRSVTESYYKKSWRQNLNNDPKLGHYRNTHSNNGIHPLWNLSVKYPNTDLEFGRNYKTVFFTL